MKRTTFIALALAIGVAAWIPVTSQAVSGYAGVRDGSVPPCSLCGAHGQAPKLAQDSYETSTLFVRDNDGLLRPLSAAEIANGSFVTSVAPHPSPLYRLLNIRTSAALPWVALGLLGQMLYTIRMVVQWVASERSKSSVVPPAFWWISIAAASVLIAYFIWRRDIIGILGSCAGVFIYTRNLALISRNKLAAS